MKKTTEQFIQQSLKIHGGKYDYRDVVYRGVTVKVTIQCPVHGSFEQLPGNHLSRKSGCPECAKGTFGAYKKQKANMSFVSDCTSIHHNKYDYSKAEYRTSHGKIIVICPDHGEFKIAAYSHRQGRGCSKCSVAKRSRAQTLTTEEFTKRAAIVHNDKYVYDYVDYVSAKTKVQIVCRIHGPFFQRPDQHMRGEGCPECGRECWWSQQGGYSLDYFKKNPPEKAAPAILYFIKFYNQKELFYKVGVTKRDIKSRFHWGYSEYNMDIIYTKQTTLYDAYITEQQILKQCKTNHYVPLIKIGGWTECFNKHINLKQLESLFTCF